MLGAQFLEQFQLHAGIARAGETTRDLAQTTVLFLENLRADFFADETQERADFFDVLARRMHRRGFTVGGDRGDLTERALKLLACDPAHSGGETFAGL